MTDFRGTLGHSPLHALAERMGIQLEYTPVGRHEPQRTSDATCIALLRAMGIDASSDEAVHRAFLALDAEHERRWLEPARVLVRHDDAPTVIDIPVPASLGDRVDWRAELRREDGGALVAEGTADRGAGASIRIDFGEALPHGYHELSVRVRGDDEERAGAQRLIVAPPRCVDVATALDHSRVWGITANLYSVRSARSWGAGDCGDLHALVEWSALAGAAFVGVNPLHALRNRGHDISPYSPVSRLFRNVLYLDVEEVPELAESDEARRALASEDVACERARLAALARVDYEGVMALKRPILELLHAEFARRHRGRDDERGRAYAAFLADEGEALDDFATFCALDEAASERRPPFDSLAHAPGWWREWPVEHQDARSAAVAAFRVSHAERVDFHRWLQFELDRQLGEVQRRARSLGMPIGIYQDLAIGSAPSGSEPWAWPEMFARGVSIGAPPDPLGPLGQNWGLPPLDPHRLAADGYRYFTQLLRTAFRDAGALRIDHVMGLFRQFWIPEGEPASEGAYVRYPSEALLAILALESERTGAIVVGEDLGTVPPEVPPALARWGVLSSRVLYFERDGARFRAPQTYPRHALATVNTHDLAPLAGFWNGDDLELRHRVGVLDGARIDEEWRRREAERHALLVLLAHEGLVADPHAMLDDAEVRAAVHALLRRTPSWLVGLSLDDVAGEREPVNVPGVGPDTFPSWTRRMCVSVEALPALPSLPRLLGVERAPR